MLGLADSSHDPTPLIQWRPPWWWGAIGVVIGAAELVYGAVRLPAELVTGIVFVLNGALFVLLGVTRILSRRRAPGSDGGTGPRP